MYVLKFWLSIPEIVGGIEIRLEIMPVKTSEPTISPLHPESTALAPKDHNPKARPIMNGTC